MFRFMYMYAFSFLFSAMARLLVDSPRYAYGVQVMHQSFVSPAALGPGIPGT